MAEKRTVMKKLPVLVALGFAGAAALLLAKALKDTLDWELDWEGILSDDYIPHGGKR